MATATMGMATVQRIVDEREIGRDRSLAANLAANLVEAGLDWKDATRVFERELVRAVLKASRNNQCRAAARMGIHRNTFGRHMEELGVVRERLPKKSPRREMSAAQ